jgi:plastocyanin
MRTRRLQTQAQTLLLLAGLCHTAWSADVQVAIVNYAFVPATTNVNVGDTVTWTWYGDYHSTTATNGLWDSGVYNTGYVYSFTFPSAGDFPYICTVHLFAGEIDVGLPPVPPTVTLTNPAADSTFSAPATIDLAASVVDTNAAVTSVMFFQGANLLGTVTNNPYSLVVSNLVAGSYNFSAVATDTNGLAATNSVSIQVVTPVSPSISAPVRNASSFEFSYGASPGLWYEVQRAVTLPEWVPISTNLAAGTSVLFQDSNAPTNTAYYRVMLVPNPTP